MRPHSSHDFLLSFPVLSHQISFPDAMLFQLRFSGSSVLCVFIIFSIYFFLLALHFLIMLISQFSWAETGHVGLTHFCVLVYQSSITSLVSCKQAKNDHLFAFPTSILPIDDLYRIRPSHRTGMDIFFYGFDGIWSNGGFGFIWSA